MALGVGTNTAILSVVDAVRRPPLPFDDASALVSVWLERPRDADAERIRLTAADLADLRSEPGLFAALAGWRGTSPTLVGVDGAEVVTAAQVTAGMFSGVLRVQPLLGRTFLPEEDRPGASPTVVLSHAFWSERFGADPASIGLPVVLDGVPHVVVGVLPPGLRPPFRPDAQLWTPARFEVERCRAGCPAVAALGRLANGTALEVARQRGAAVAERLAESYPDTNEGVTLALASLADQRVRISAGSVRALLLAGGLVLLIACANVALLLLARGIDRIDEMRVRRSLGASGWRLVRQLFGESLGLALVGGLLGLGLASWGVEALTRTAPTGLFEAGRPSVGGAILVLVLLLTTLTGVLFGSAPAVVAARRATRVPGSRKTGGDVSPRLRGVLSRLARGGTVALQMGLATALAIGAGGLVQGLQNATADELGFDADGLLTIQVALPPEPFAGDEARLDLARRLEGRIGEVPGAFSVGTTGSLPLDEEEEAVPLVVEGDARSASDPPGSVLLRPVSARYFYTVGQRLAEGRWFRPEDDGEGVPAVILNATAARRFFRDPPHSPLGSRVHLGRGWSGWRTVVGVVRDERASSEERPAVAVAYVPLAQAPPGTVTVLVRVDGEPQDLAEDVRIAVAEVDPTLQAGVIEPMADRVGAAYAGERFGVVVATAFAVVALLLSALGLYGILAHGVVSRLRELGVRRALGATDGDLRRAVLGRAFLVAAAGIAVGWAGAAFVAEGLDAALAGAGLRTPIVYALTVTVMAVAALAASAWPVHRSVGVDAVTALRPDGRGRVAS